MLYWSSFLLFLFRLRFRLSISVFFFSFLSVDYLFGCFICWYWCNRSSFFFFSFWRFFFLLLLEIFWADIAVRVFSLFTGLTYGSSAASSTKVTRLFPQVKVVVCLYVHVHHARVFGSFSHDYSYQRRCKVDSQNAGLNTWGRGPQLLSFFYFFFLGVFFIYYSVSISDARNNGPLFSSVVQTKVVWCTPFYSLFS